LLSATLRASAGPSIPPAIQNAFRFDAPGNINAIGFDSAGNLYLAGVTIGLPLPAGTTVIGQAQGNASFVMKIAPSTSPHFPTTVNGFQPTSGIARSAYLVKLASSGKELIYSTYFGQYPTTATALAIDADGNAYLAGNTNGATFPTTAGAYQTSIATAPGDGATGFIGNSIRQAS
jgi:hypothetical protein